MLRKVDAQLDRWSRDALTWLNTGRRPVYHGTGAQFGEQIRSEGLHPACDGAYVTRNWQVARWYAIQRSSHLHVTHGHPWLGVVLELDVASEYLKRSPLPKDPDHDEEELVLTAAVAPAAIVSASTIEWNYDVELAHLLDEWLKFDRHRCPLCSTAAPALGAAPLDGLDALPGPRPSPEAEQLLRAVMPYATTFARGSGQHGPRHWRRAALLGEELAAATPGADVELVRLFAMLHDCRRETDDRDPEHGPRAARLAGELDGEAWPSLSETRLRLLRFACERHSEGSVTPDPAVAVCFDSDRLDMWRLAQEPKLALLSTAAARRPEVIRRAWRLNGQPTPLAEIERRLAELDLQGVQDIVRRVAGRAV